MVFEYFFFIASRLRVSINPVIVLLGSTYISFYNPKCEIIRLMGFILKKAHDYVTRK